MAQVGHTTPGTLALKFAKYQGNSVVLQPSFIEEREFRQGFSQQYLRQLRNEASRFGNQSMRVMLVCRAAGQGELTTDKIEVASIMPHTVENSSHVPETFQNQLPNRG